jgi:hypothetical protein
MTCKLNADTSDGLKIVSDTSGEIDLQIDASTKVHMDSGGQIGIGTTSPSGSLHINTSSANILIADTDDSSGSYSRVRSDASGSLHLEADVGNNTGSSTMRFNTDGTEHMRINGSGTVMFETTDTSPWNNGAGTAGGTAIGASDIVGLIASARVQGDPLALNYIDGSNGNLVAFYQNGSFIGNISWSGTTVSYNAFTGSHPSRLTDNLSPAILKGTVMETLDAMCDWYEIHYTVTDLEGNNVAKVKEIVLPDGKSVGDNHTMEIDGSSRTGTIVARGNEKHMQCKVSDTEDSTRIYGVFSDYLNGDTTVYNDMNINAVGTSVIRVASGTTVSAGDLLSSKGDGTAKLQGDDIIKTKTIGKVLSNVKQETYSDGSYTVPCALYCG